MYISFTHSHTYTHTDGCQCLAQGHFDNLSEGAVDQATEKSQTRPLLEGAHTTSLDLFFI